MVEDVDTFVLTGSMSVLPFGSAICIGANSYEELILRDWIIFDYTTKVLVYVKGEEQLVELTDHTCGCILLSGEVVFAILAA